MRDCARAEEGPGCGAIGTPCPIDATPLLTFDAITVDSPDTEEPWCLLLEVKLEGEGGIQVELNEDVECVPIDTPEETCCRLPVVKLEGEGGMQVETLEDDGGAGDTPFRTAL